MKDVNGYFGCKVFDDRAMKATLSAKVYQSLRKTIDEGAILDLSVANAVAEAVEVKRMPTFDTQSPKFTKIEIIFKEEKLYVLKEAMNKLGITGMTVSQTNMSS